MTKIIQQVMQDTIDASAYIGLPGVVIVDTGDYSLRVHDGVNPGGNKALSANNNLSELSNPALARDALGLGSASQNDTADFLVAANALSEISDTAAARANIEAAQSGANVDITSLEIPFGGYRQLPNPAFPLDTFLDTFYIVHDLAKTAPRFVALKHPYDADVTAELWPDPATPNNIRMGTLASILLPIADGSQFTARRNGFNAHDVTLTLVCQVSEFGYPIGFVLWMPSTYCNNAGTGYASAMDPATGIVTFRLSAANITVTKNDGSGLPCNLTLLNWKLQYRATWCG